MLLGSEFSFDTASDDRLGTGKHTVAPIGIVEFFFENGWIFAPAYQHAISYAGMTHGRTSRSEPWTSMS